MAPMLTSPPRSQASPRVPQTSGLRNGSAYSLQQLALRIVLLFISLPLSLLGSGPAEAACSNEDFEKAFAVYQQAEKESSAGKRIRLFEKAFSVCPTHGRFARGYYRLGKLYLDNGQKDKAIKWLSRANRFRAIMIQSSLTDLADTNRLLADLFKDRGEMERSLIHINLHRALAALQRKKAPRDFVYDPEPYYDVIYTPGTVKTVLAPYSSVPSAYRSTLTRLEIYFETGSSALTSQARKRLCAIAQALENSEFTGCTMVIEGHTDERGTADQNVKLGRRRAHVAKTHLEKSANLVHLKLVPVGYGESKPAIPRRTCRPDRRAEADRLNRRVVIWNQGRVDHQQKSSKSEGIQ